jgi:hypothetical protein
MCIESWHVITKITVVGIGGALLAHHINVPANNSLIDRKIGVDIVLGNENTT